MRMLLLLAPCVLLAQTPAPKTSTPAPKTRTTAPKPAATKPGSAKRVTAAKPKPAAASTAPMTDDEKIVYALGLSMYRSLGQFDLTPAEREVLKRALDDAAAGKPAIEISEWGPKIQGLAHARASKLSAGQKVASKAYLDKAATEPGAVRTESGLVYRELLAGTGAHPNATDTVKVHYRGTLVDGTEFDSSYKRNEPAQFQLNGVIKCWTEGVQKMSVGGKAVLVCPSDLAYGDQGRPSIPGGAALVFEIELLDIAGGAPAAPESKK